MQLKYLIIICLTGWECAMFHLWYNRIKKNSLCWVWPLHVINQTIVCIIPPDNVCATETQILIEIQKMRIRMHMLPHAQTLRFVEQQIAQNPVWYLNKSDSTHREPSQAASACSSASSGERWLTAGWWPRFLLLLEWHWARQRRHCCGGSVGPHAVQWRSAGRPAERHVNAMYRTKREH